MEVIEVIDYVITGFVLIVGTFGNGLAIISIIKFDWMKTQTNYFVCMLAFSDLLYALPAQVLHKVANLDINSGSTDQFEIVCRTNKFLTMFSGTGDMFAMMFITIDRYIRMVLNHGLKYELILTKKRVIITCLCGAALAVI